MATSNNTGKKPASSARRGTRAAKTIDIEANKKKPADTKPAAGTAKSSSAIPDTKTAPKPSAAKSGEATPGAAKAVTAEKSGSFSGMVVSALLGGVVAIGGLGVIGQLDNAGSLPLVGSMFAKTEGEKVDLSNLASLDEIAALKTEISALAARLDSAQEQLRTAGVVDLSVIEGKIAALEQKDNAPAKLDDETIGRINDLGLKSKANGEQLEQLAAQLAGLKVAQSSPGQNPASDEALAKLAKLESALGEIENQASAVTERISKMEGQFSPELFEKIENMSKIAENAKMSEKIARSVAVSALQTAIDQKMPYLNALVSIETLYRPTEATKQLKELATGANVPNLEVLQQQFRSIADKLIPSVAGDDNAGVFDKLVSSAKSLIKVRSSTPISGNTAQAIVSRIDAQLALGNLAKVVEEWNGLPEGSKTVSNSWIEGVKMRMESDRLLKLVLKQASEGLGVE